MFFPYEQMRPGQKEFYQDCLKSFKSGENLIANAPTGIGKTAAVLSAALEYALEHGKLIFFLTSRHSQHYIAVETLKLIKEKTSQELIVCDIINKPDMCLQDFSVYLNRDKFESKCYHYRRAAKCKYHSGKNTAYYLVKSNPMHVKEVQETCSEMYSCPYYLMFELLKEANVVVTDYNYILDPGIREIVLKRAEISLDDCIIIIDEAHNLPNRARGLDSYLLDKRTLLKAKSDVEEYLNNPMLSEALGSIASMFSENVKGEAIVSPDSFVSQVNDMFSVDFVGDVTFSKFIRHLKRACDDLSELSQESFFLSELINVQLFFDYLMLNSNHRVNIKNDKAFEITSLDPSFLCGGIFKSSHSVILMSGTLHPPNLYKEILGIKEVNTKRYSSPFPTENKFILVDESVTSAYTKRSEEMYTHIGERLTELLNVVPGNVAVFFPSYHFMNDIRPYIETQRQLIIEDPKYTKEDRDALIQKLYKSEKNLLLGVQSGSFSEGIDYKNNSLKAVFLVGLPVDPPSLEKRCLVEYYNQKYGNGEEIAYTLPLINKILQSSGRLIRSFEDKGIVVLMDKRYADDKYAKYYPKGFEFIKSGHIEKHIEKFFDE